MSEKCIVLLTVSCVTTTNISTYLNTLAAFKGKSGPYILLRFEVLTMVKMFFHVVTPRRLTGRYLQSLRWRQFVSLKCWNLS